ncbi:MAG: LacI family DNA-binding transcriptional regulator [Thermotogae bacterium]|nr:LacI family DNA-binding transcriptional regulator [Thermotogota bacterium]
MGKEINYDDIAKISGVSKATVSKVINNYSGVSEKSREKVIDACKKLDYTPNFLARSLRLNKTNSIGLIVPDLSNQFFSRFSKGVHQEALKNNYTVLIGDSLESSDIEKKLVKEFSARKVDGLIIISTNQNNNYPNSQIPIVFSDRHVEGAKNEIFSNNFLGGYKGMDFLVNRKKRERILILSGPKRFQTNQQRLSGCVEFILNHNPGVNYEIREIETVDVENAELYAIKNFQFIKSFDAIFALSDLLALGVMKVIRNKVKIPEDISVLGYDDIKECEYVTPELSSIHQKKKTMGIEAFNMILSLINEEKLSNDKIVLSVDVIERSST